MAWTYDSETEIYTVSYNELEDLLLSLADNTADTAYKLNITDLVGSELSAPYPLRNKIKNYLTKYVDLSVTTFPAVVGFTDFNSGWNGCSNLVKTFPIPDGVTNLQYCFSGCSSLKTLPYIPSTVTNYKGVCNGCTSLTKGFIPSSVTAISNAFFECTSLQEVRAEKNSYSGISATDYANVFNYCSSLSSITVPSATASSTLITLLTTEQNQGRFPSGININNLVSVVPWSYNELTGVWTVPFADLTTMLNTFDDNTVDTPYKINVTGLTAANCYTNTGSGTNCSAFGLAIRGTGKFVDLSPTTIPSTSYMRSFMTNVTELVVAPTPHTSCQYFEYAFYGCINLKAMPTLPANTNNLNYCFLACSSLTEVSNIPANVRYMQHCFQGCDNLETMPTFLNTGATLDLTNCFMNCEKLKYTTTIPTGARSMVECFAYCLLLEETPEMGNGATDLTRCFLHCTSLKKANLLPTTVTNMTGCFYECTLLETVERVPRATTYIKECFYGCSALERINLWNYNSVSTGDNYSKDCFTDCDSLAHIYVNGYNSGSRNNLVTFLTNRQNNGYFPSDITVADIVFYGYTEGYSIAFSNLNNYLMYLEPNTVDNPYKLTVTGLSVSNVNTSTTSGSLGYVIAHNTKYLDLSLTSLHANQTTMKERFNECTYLVVSPNIPNNVTDMEACYSGCHNLKTPPTLSTKTTNMKDCFVYCTSLESAPVIPNTVTTLHGTFYGCTSLEEPPEIPDSVTIMGGTFFGCTSLAEAPVIPDSVYELSSCFYGCTSLDKAPIIPSSVTTMADTFVGCTNLEIAPIIPDSVTFLQDCFMNCTSLVDVPSIPRLSGQLDDLSSAFDGCSALKRVNFNRTFDLTFADFDSAFNDCDDLESIFVKSSANRTALITYLESQQNDGKFPSGLNVSEIVKFDEKTMRVQTEEGTEIVDLYRFKGQLLTEKNGELVYADEDFKPFSVQIDNETFFAQTIPESLLATCRNKGSGTVLKKMVGTEIVEGITTPVCQWFTKSAGTLEEPFQREYTELDVYTEDESDIELDPSDFPKGGVILLYGGAGGSVASSSDYAGTIGGKGQIKRIEIPANPKGNYSLSVSFTKTSTNGTKATNSTSAKHSVTPPGCSYTTCESYNPSVSSTDGGVGGKNCSVILTKNGVSESVIAYGGGGAGGRQEKLDYIYTCNSISTRTLLSGYGNGGTSGNGNPGNGSTGGDADTTGTFALNTLTTAKLVIGAYI
jgi:hypothetical protein